jgi:hypothetical protein
MKRELTPEPLPQDRPQTIKVIRLKNADRATLQTMAARYRVTNLMHFVEGILAATDKQTEKKAIRDLGDSIQAEMHEAFAAGWNAFVARHSSFLISHSIADTRTGLEQAWEKYWKSRKEK